LPVFEIADELLADGGQLLEALMNVAPGRWRRVPGLKGGTQGDAGANPDLLAASQTDPNGVLTCGNAGQRRAKQPLLSAENRVGGEC
jgi:hypothetical protein